MNAPIDDDLRATLHAWADGVALSAGDATDAMTPTAGPAAPASSSRALLWAAGAAAACVLTAGLVASRDVAVLHNTLPGNTIPEGTAMPAGTIPMPAGTIPMPAGPLLDIAAPVVAHPDDPGWQLAGVLTMRYSWTTAIGLRHADGRRIGLQMHPLGCCPTPMALTPGTVPGPTVRGHPALAGNLDGVEVITWEEAGYTWRLQEVEDPADTEPLPRMTADELADLATAFELVDRTTFEAWLPAEALTAFRANADAKYFDWQPGREPIVTR
jgi:hypothetical protein